MKNNSVKILDFPLQAERCLPNAEFIKSEFGFIRVQINDNRLLNAGIYKNDCLIINTLESIGNGDFIAVQLTENSLDCGIANFIGGGVLQLQYANKNFPPKHFKIEKIKLLGRAVRLERNLTEGE